MSEEQTQKEQVIGLTEEQAVAKPKKQTRAELAVGIPVSIVITAVFVIFALAH